MEAFQRKKLCPCSEGVMATPTPAENHDLTGCFACGSSNTFGLVLRFMVEGDMAVAEVLCRPAG